jgi:hypothetical protein
LRVKGEFHFEVLGAFVFLPEFAELPFLTELHAAIDQNTTQSVRKP